MRSTGIVLFRRLLPSLGLMCGALGLFLNNATAQTVTTFDVLVATETLTVVGTTTVSGNAFSVGRSSFIVTQGNVGVGTATPVGLFTIGNGTITVLNTGSVGIGTTTPTALLHLVGSIIGGTGTQFQWIASSGAMRSGEIDGSQWSSANIGAYSVSFGFDNIASGKYSSILGGQNNQASTNEAFIGNGNNNAVIGAEGVVIGGSYNQARASFDLVGNGYGNFASGSYSAVLNGFTNNASGQYSSVAGGEYNSAQGIASVVAGGGALSGGSPAGNTAAGASAAILGGVYNQTSADFSAVAGGYSNAARGQYSFVAGGANNVATGQYSFAAGQRATASGQGSFVWGDSQNAGITAANNDEFKIRAQGGFVFYASPTSPTIIVSSGAVQISTSPSAATAVPNIFISSTNGNVGIQTTIPAASLDVNGTAQLGSGATKSTFTAAGALSLASGASLSLAGASGFINSSSSVTASAFFGDGSHLSGISSGVYVAKSGDSMSGPLSMVSGATITISGNAFSVGVATFVVSGGAVGIATAPIAGYPLTVLQNPAAPYQTLNLLAATSGFMNISPAMSAGDFNGITQKSDAGIIFSSSTIANAVGNIGSFVLAPWSKAGATSGLRMDGMGNVVLGASTPLAEFQVQSNTAPANAVLMVSSQNAAALFVVQGTGNTGVGTSTPTSLLHVAGPASVLTLQDNATSGTGYKTRLSLQDSGGTERARIGRADGSEGDIEIRNLSVASTAGLAFGTGNSTRAYITGGGNVGISTTSPQALFEIRGSATQGTLVMNVDNDAPGDILTINSPGADSSVYRAWTANGVLNIGAAASGGTQNSIYARGGALLAVNTGNVGIGLTNPARPLEVNGIIRNSGANSTMEGDDGVSVHAFLDLGGIVGYGIIGPSDVGLVEEKGNNLILGTSNLERLRVNSVGSIGVGLTNPVYLLDVAGATRIGDQLIVKGTETVAGNAFSVGGSTFVVIGGNVGVGTANPASTFDVGGPIVIRRSTDLNKVSTMTMEGGALQILANTQGVNYPLTFNTAGSERVRVDTTGNVGIGVTSPASLLDVNGNAIIGSATADSAPGNLQVNGTIRLLGTASLPSVSTITYGNNGAADGIDFVPRNNTNAHIHFDANGNVGIGTTSPGRPLDVNGIIRNSGANATMEGSDVTGVRAFLDLGGNAGYGIVSSNDVGLVEERGNNLILGTNNLERLRINSSGNVGIGTTSPATNLDVFGSAQFGSGATKSTFTATGLLKLTSSGIQWADGSTSTTAATSSIIANSTWSFLTNASNDTSNTGWTTLGQCIKSTITVTVGSSSQLVYISFTGAIWNTSAGAQTNVYGALMDGKFIENESTTVGLLNSADCPGSTLCNASFNKMVTGLPAGQHNFCFSEASVAGTNGNTVKANYQFGVAIPSQ